MRWIVIIVLLIALGLIGYGLFFQSDDPSERDFYAGLGTAVFFLVFMPLLLFYRRKKISISRFMLTKESIKKMQEHSSDKNL